MNGGRLPDRGEPGYVVSAGGTFGFVQRRYTTEDGVKMVVIRWGPLNWLTPVRADEIKKLDSSYQAYAKAQAEAWLAERERKR